MGTVHTNKLSPSPEHGLASKAPLLLLGRADSQMQCGECSALLSEAFCVAASVGDDESCILGHQANKQQAQ
eukprot:2241261-Amphidinium_carterae.1